MNETQKYQIYIKKIEEMYPNKIKLNKTETCKIIGMSSTKFTGLIDTNNLKKLPKFKVQERETRNWKIYRNYSFDIHDIAMFLAEN